MQSEIFITCKQSEFCIHSQIWPSAEHMNMNVSFLGFAGDSLLEQLKVEMIADSIEDFMVKPSVPIRREKDAEKKVQAISMQWDTLKHELIEKQAFC